MKNAIKIAMKLKTIVSQSRDWLRRFLDWCDAVYPLPWFVSFFAFIVLMSIISFLSYLAGNFFPDVGARFGGGVPMNLLGVGAACFASMDNKGESGQSQVRLWITVQVGVPLGLSLMMWWIMDGDAGLVLSTVVTSLLYSPFDVLFALSDSLL